MKDIQKIPTDKEKQDILSEVYKLDTKAEISKEDIAWAKDKFKDPEDFQRLRKILRVVTEEEKGIAYQSEIASVPDEDLKRFAIDVKINNLANERIRNALLSFYVMLRDSNREDVSKKIDERVEELKRDEAQREQLKKEVELANKKYPDNV